MSGLYLVVWDDDEKENSKYLKPTKGGWPHITIVYTGRNVSVENLVKTSSLIFKKWAGKKITLRSAYVNSFKLDNGRMRHDVLLGVGEVKEIEMTRQVYVRNFFSNHYKFHMGPPHVTHCICFDEKQAKEKAKELNKILPYTVEVTGVTID